MAEVAILGGRNVVHRGILANGVDAIVTTCATNGYAGMIEYASSEFSGVMTHPAIFAGRNMRGMLAGGERTIMTRSTIPRDAIVSEYRR